MTSELDQLSEFELDALRELGNIGAGNAATALSQIVNKKILMEVPTIKIVSLNDIPDELGGPEVVIAGILIKILGDAPGNILFSLPQQSSLLLVDMIMGRPRGATQLLTGMDISALKEIGNILASSYLNAIVSMSELVMIPSVPAFAYDMAGALLDIICIEYSKIGDYALLIDTEFIESDSRINGQFFLLPNPESLDTILHALGAR